MVFVAFIILRFFAMKRLMSDEIGMLWTSGFNVIVFLVKTLLI